MIYWQLFMSFFQVGLFSFGGGYAAMALIQDHVVHKQAWLGILDFSDMITIAQSLPGSIAINAASFVGVQVGGFLGGVVATLACVLPSFLIVLTLAYIYTHYQTLAIIKEIIESLKPTVVSLIVSAGLGLLMTSLWGSEGVSLRSTNLLALSLFAGSLYSLRKYKTNPILIMMATGLVGFLAALIT